MMNSIQLLHPPGRSLRNIGVGVCCFILVMPLLCIVWMSFGAGNYFQLPPSGVTLHWYRTFFADDLWRSSFITSIEIATGAMMLALSVGVPAACHLSREYVANRGKWLFLFALPLFLPSLIAAVGLEYAASICDLLGSRTVLIVVDAALAIPVVMLPVMSALTRLPVHIERQAISLGASPVRAYLFAIIPEIPGSLLTAAVFAFITSFDELTFALFLGGGDANTLPRKLWESTRFDMQPILAVPSTILLIGAILATGISTKIIKPKIAS